MSTLGNIKVALDKSTIQVIRAVCHEMKRGSKQIENKNNESIKHFLKQCRLYQTTELRTCTGKNEPRFMAETYLTYLESSRKFKELNQAYSGKGDRSIAETANLVGFKLPNEC